jgi:hypothetical protein
MGADYEGSVPPTSFECPFLGRGNDLAEGTVGGQALRSVRPVIVSYVLRVRPDRVSKRRFSGEVEAVATGQRFAVRSLEELLAVVLETVGEESALGRSLSVET